DHGEGDLRLPVVEDDRARPEIVVAPEGDAVAAEPGHVDAVVLAFRRGSGGVVSRVVLVGLADVVAPVSVRVLVGLTPDTRRRDRTVPRQIRTTRGDRHGRDTDPEIRAEVDVVVVVGAACERRGERQGGEGRG